MKKNFMSFFGSMLLLAPLVGVAIPQSAHAWNKNNALYRCTMQARPTVCYEAWTMTTDYHEEICAAHWIRAKTIAVYGGGVFFATLPTTDVKKDLWSDCNYSNPGNSQVGHKSWISPCAPGGPAGWKHFTEHTIDWKEGWGWGYNDVDYLHETKQLPLPVSTCPGGGVLQ